MSKDKVQKIKFQGLDFILTDPDDEDSPITTIGQYQNGEVSYAHLFRSTGQIMQFQQEIGKIDEIEFGDIIEIEMAASQFLAGIFGDSWPV